MVSDPDKLFVYFSIFTGFLPQGFPFVQRLPRSTLPIHRPKRDIREANVSVNSRDFTIVRQSEFLTFRREETSFFFFLLAARVYIELCSANERTLLFFRVVRGNDPP